MKNLIGIESYSIFCVRHFRVNTLYMYCSCVWWCEKLAFVLTNSTVYECKFLRKQTQVSKNCCFSTVDRRESLLVTNEWIESINGFKDLGVRDKLVTRSRSTKSSFRQQEFQEHAAVSTQCNIRIRQHKVKTEPAVLRRTWEFQNISFCDSRDLCDSPFLCFKIYCFQNWDSFLWVFEISDCIAKGVGTGCFEFENTF